MSVKQYVTEVEKVSNNVEKILEKTKTKEELIELFFTYYKMLNLIENSLIETPFSNRKKS